MFHLIDAGYVLCNGGFSQHVESPEDALIWEVQVTVAMVAVLFDRFLQGTFLGDVSLFVAVIAEVVAASAS